MSVEQWATNTGAASLHKRFATAHPFQFRVEIETGAKMNVLSVDRAPLCWVFHLMCWFANCTHKSQMPSLPGTTLPTTLPTHREIDSKLFQVVVVVDPIELLMKMRPEFI